MVRGSRDSKWGGAGFGAILADFVMVVVVMVVVVDLLLCMYCDSLGLSRRMGDNDLSADE